MKTRRLRKSRTLLAGFIIVTVLAVAAVLIWQSSLSAQNAGPKAAIVDQLSLTSPNPVFVQVASKDLTQAGYSVDYFPWAAVTVDFYRELPSRGYSVLVLRVKAGADETGKAVAFFTTELYSANKYQEELLNGQLGRVQEGDGASYFGVSQEFVAKGMNGRFQNSLVVMMDSKGIFFTDLMGRAFVDERGAKVVVGWSDTLSWFPSELGDYYSDRATVRFLQHLIVKREGLRDSVNATMTDVGSDPLYDESKLVYYPVDSEFTMNSVGPISGLGTGQYQTADSSRYFGRSSKTPDLF